VMRLYTYNILTNAAYYYDMLVDERSSQMFKINSKVAIPSSLRNEIGFTMSEQDYIAKNEILRSFIFSLTSISTTLVSCRKLLYMT
jgi:hypothetical protein